MLLILAGVSISLVVGDNGVLTQAQSASTKTDAASANSAVELTASTLTTKFMGENWVNNVNADIRDTVDKTKFDEELQKNGYQIVTPNSWTNENLASGVEITIKEKGATASDATTYSFTLKAKTADGDNYTSLETTKITEADNN